MDPKQIITEIHELVHQLELAPPGTIWEEEFAELARYRGLDVRDMRRKASYDWLVDGLRTECKFRSDPPDAVTIGKSQRVPYAPGEFDVIAMKHSVGGFLIPMSRLCFRNKVRRKINLASYRDCIWNWQVFNGQHHKQEHLLW